jgi:hypothetical protein
VRNAPHGRDIAKSASEATVAYRVRRMPVATKVDAFKREVGGDEEFVSARDGQDGAVVTNTSRRLIAASLGEASETVDQIEFGQGHGDSFQFRDTSFKKQVVRCQLSVVRKRKIVEVLDSREQERRCFRGSNWHTKWVCHVSGSAMFINH